MIGPIARKTLPVWAFVKPNRDGKHWDMPSCPFCGHKHQHGADGGMDWGYHDGHRVPHCSDQRPRKFFRGRKSIDFDGGYFLTNKKSLHGQFVDDATFELSLPLQDVKGATE